MIYEALRVFLYIVGSFVSLHLAIILPKARLSFLGISIYFVMWFALLLYQFRDPDDYRRVANLVSTPGLFIIVIMLFLNMWTTRRE